MIVTFHYNVITYALKADISTDKFYVLFLSHVENTLSYTPTPPLIWAEARHFSCYLHLILVLRTRGMYFPR